MTTLAHTPTNLANAIPTQHNHPEPFTPTCDCGTPARGEVGAQTLMAPGRIWVPAHHCHECETHCALTRTLVDRG